ncbi:hypothetical protein [Streptomyces nigrescens]|uniref:hypothetical protein n=1 Tax=Streptomyces nigrescens TaxID=1920 RepID=UPI003701D38B
MSTVRWWCMAGGAQAPRHPTPISPQQVYDPADLVHAEESGSAQFGEQGLVHRTPITVRVRVRVGRN